MKEIEKIKRALTRQWQEGSSLRQKVWADRSWLRQRFGSRPAFYSDLATLVAEGIAERQIGLRSIDGHPIKIFSYRLRA